MDGCELKRKFYEAEAAALLGPPRAPATAASSGHETNEDRTRRLALRREREAQRRELETADEKAQRLAARREREAQRRGLETTEEKAQRLAQRRRKDAARRGQETAEEKAQRLALRRAREAQRRGQETSLEKFQRLALRRQRQRDAAAREAASAHAPAAPAALPFLDKPNAPTPTPAPVGLADKPTPPRFAPKPEAPTLSQGNDSSPAAQQQHTFLLPAAANLGNLGNLCGTHGGLTNLVALEDYFPSSLWAFSEARTDCNIQMPRGVCN